MISRDDLIETAARAIHGDSNPGDPWPCPEDGCDDYREIARVVLDAVWPHIATAEQLDALPVGSVVLNSVGWTWTLLSTGVWQHLACGSMDSRTLIRYGPFMVVWQS